MFRNNNKKKLEKLDDSLVPLFTLKGSYYAKIVDVYDGDTITVCFYRNKECIKVKCRMYGYDSPEMRPSKKLENREEIKKNAILARDRLSELTNKNNNIVKIECLEFDKYGRVLTKVYSLENEYINDIMVNENHGVPYFGGKK